MVVLGSGMAGDLNSLRNKGTRVVTEMVMGVDKRLASPSGGLEWHGQSDASFPSGYLVQLPQGYLVQMEPEVVPLWSSPVVEVAVDHCMLSPAVNAVHEQHVYCAPAPLVDGVDMDSLYVANGAPVYLGSVESAQCLHQLEYHVLPAGMQISTKGAASFITQNLGGEQNAKPVTLHSSEEMFQGDILVQRDDGHQLCISQAQPALVTCGKHSRKQRERIPEVSGSDNSSSDVSAQAKRVEECCNGKHCPGVVSNDASLENAAKVNEARLCMSLADSGQNPSQRESVDFDFSALVEVARCEETCKHTGRKSGSSHFLGVSKHRKSGR